MSSNDARRADNDEIEARVGEGKVLGLGVQRPDIGKAPARRKLPRFAQHFLGDVGGGDPGDVGSKGKRGMASAGGDVEHAPMRFRLGELDEALEACALGVYLGGGVVRRRSTKPLLC